MPRLGLLPRLPEDSDRHCSMSACPFKVTSEVDSPTRPQALIRQRPRDGGSQVPGMFSRLRDLSEGRVGHSDPARDRSDSSLNILYINCSVLCPIPSTRYPSELAFDLRLRLRLPASLATVATVLRLRLATCVCDRVCDLRLRPTPATST